jgi:O-antigen ligase
VVDAKLVRSADASLVRRARTDLALPFLLAVLPFCAVVRWPPHPGFWGQWLAVLVVLLWVVVRLPSARAIPWAAFAFLAPCAMLLLHSAAGLAAMSMATTLAALTLAVAAAACIAAQSPGGPATREGYVRAFAWGLIVALVLNAVAVVLGWLGYEFHLYRIVEVPAVPRRALGLIGQANHLAMLAVLATFGAWMLRQRAALSHNAFWLVALLAAVTCAATASRIALLVCAALLLLAWIATPAAGAVAKRATSRPTLLLLALLFAGVQVAWSLSLSGRGGGGTPDISRPSGGRLDMLRDAAELWWREPLLGIGHGNYAARRLHDLDGELQAPHADNAHNLVAQALVEWGALGAAIALTALAFTACLVWRNVRAKDLTPETWFTCAWLVGMLLHNQVEQPLWFMHFLLPTAVMLGLLKQPVITVRTQITAASRRAVLAAYLAVVSVMTGVAWDYSRAQSLALAMLADLDRPWGVPPQVTFADVASIESFTLFPQYAKIMLSRKLPLGDVAAQAKLELARQAMDAVPNSETIARYCAFAVVAGQGESARSLLEQLRRRSPPGYYQRAHELLDSWRVMDGRLDSFVMALPSPPAMAAAPAPVVR